VGKLKLEEIVVLNSGGLDSLVVMSIMADTFKHIHSVFIDYGHPSSDIETQASQVIADYYGATHHTEYLNLDIWQRQPFFRTPNTKNPYLPNRNFVMFGIGAAYCDGMKIPQLGLAWDGRVIDNTLYSMATDAHAQFVNKLVSAFDESSMLGWDYSTSLRVYAPLLNKTKEEIGKLGLEYNAPFELSWSCYAGGLDRRTVCGKCVKCKERKRLVPLGITDQYNYYADVTKGKITNV
jgi:7-cyano-7-deazaguanine synthase